MKGNKKLSEIIYSKKEWVRGAVAGFLWSGILYGFSWMFFKPEFVYAFREGVTAIIFGTIGAALFGAVLSKINVWRDHGNYNEN